VSGEKIVFISTHDPLLALRGDQRLVIRNGGITEVLATSAPERANLDGLEAVDATLMDIRDRLRRGLRIEELRATAQCLGTRGTPARPRH
jgi:hypothetical protein